MPLFKYRHKSSMTFLMQTSLYQCYTNTMLNMFYSNSRVRFGRPIFYMNLTIYIGYLISLTTYVALMIKESPVKIRGQRVPYDDTYYCPVVLGEKEKNNHTLEAYYLKVNMILQIQDYTLEFFYKLCIR